MRTAPLLLLAVAVAATDLLIFHTTDMHGYLYGHIHDKEYDATLADVRSYIDYVNASEPDTVMFTFDSGDVVQGTGLSDATDPPGTEVYAIEDIFLYDGATLGNHDVGNEETMVWLYSTSFLAYGVTSNILWTNDTFSACTYDLPPFRAPYRILERGGVRLLVLGFMYVDARYETPTCTGDIAAFFASAAWAEAAAALEAVPPHLVVSLNHIASTDAENLTPIYEGLRAALGDVPILMLNGHSHNFVSGLCADMGVAAAAGDDQCIFAESGHYLFQFGQIRLALRDEGAAYPRLDADAAFHTEVVANAAALQAACAGAAWPSEQGARVQAAIDGALDELQLFSVLGHAKAAYPHGAAVAEPDSLWRLYLNGAMSCVFAGNDPVVAGATDVPIFNSGSLRADMYAGPVLLDDLYYILPFPNEFMYILPSVSGALFKRVYAYLNELDIAAGALRASDEDYVIPVNFTDFDDAEQLTLVSADYDVDPALLGALELLNPGTAYAAHSYPAHGYNQMSALQSYIEQYMRAGVAVASVSDAATSAADYPGTHHDLLVGLAAVSLCVLVAAAAAQLATLGTRSRK